MTFESHKACIRRLLFGDARKRSSENMLCTTVVFVQAHKFLMRRLRCRSRSTLARRSPELAEVRDVGSRHLRSLFIHPSRSSPLTSLVVCRCLQGTFSPLQKI